MAEARDPQVAIVILAYNSAGKVRRCLASLAALCYPNAEIVVVDNNSADHLEKVIKQEFPHVAFIQTGANLGYTGGNNRGIEYALANGADYVLILNPDTVLINPGFLTEMAAYCELNADVGIVGPRVFLRALGQVQNTVLFAPGFWRSAWNWISYRVTPSRFMLSQDCVREAEVLNGVCVMLRAACLRATGLFDEAVFMYIEDADLDFRARRAGWAVRYLPIDSIVHEQQIEGYGMTSMPSFLLRRNSVYYLCKIGKRYEAWAYAAFSLALLLGRAMLSFSLKSARGYLIFCERLAAAYRQILLNQPFDQSFGPPYGTWR